MAVRTLTFQITLLVIIIVGLLIVIHSAWTLSELNRTNGDSCDCSGVSDHEITNLRIYSIFMLLIGFGMMVYAVVMFLVPVGDTAPQKTPSTVPSGMIRERFLQKDD